MNIDICPSCNNNLNNSSYSLHDKYCYDEYSCDSCKYMKLFLIKDINFPNMKTINKPYKRDNSLKVLEEEIIINKVRFKNFYYRKEENAGYISCLSLNFWKDDVPMIKDLKYFNKKGLLRKANNILLLADK